MTGFSNDIVFNNKEVVPERVTVRGTVKSMHMRQHDVIKTADWVLHLRPEGGDNGGGAVAAGTPEQVAHEHRSYTGGYLRDLLAKSVRVELTPPRPKKKCGSVSMREREAAE